MAGTVLHSGDSEAKALSQPSKSFYEAFQHPPENAIAEMQGLGDKGGRDVFSRGNQGCIFQKQRFELILNSEWEYA